MNGTKIFVFLLRVLIGVGFTFSLVLGVALTMLTLFSSTGNNLVLNRTSLDWGWGGGAAVAWASTLFWWFCWRCLPAVKPTLLFPSLERSQQKPASIFSILISAMITMACLCFVTGTGFRLATHATGASWPQFLCWSLLTVSNGWWTFLGWKQWQRKKQTKLFVDKFYRQG